MHALRRCVATVVPESLEGIEAMAVCRSPLVKFLLLILCCCDFAFAANSAQRPSVVFVFGDSFTDTGNGVREFHPRLIVGAFQPYGRTYFGQAVGRYSDGRVLVDFIVQSLGLPFLNPFLDFVGTDFSNGANYAVGGSFALNIATLLDEFGYESVYPYTLVEQLQWHLSFLQHAEAGMYGVTRFPTMPAIRQGLYFICIGSNDLTSVFETGSSTESLRNLIHLVVAKVTEAVQLLYEHGARNFLLATPFPVGCSPGTKAFFSAFDLDDRGCLPTLNDLVRNYSTSLAAISKSLNDTLPDATVAFLDLYSALDEMFTHPDRYGILDTLNVCCATVNFPAASLVNGFTSSTQCGPLSSVCKDPDTYLNWDGFHYTENTVRQIVNMFLEGKFIVPAEALTRFGATQIPKDLSHSSVIR